MTAGTVDPSDSSSAALWHLFTRWIKYLDPFLAKGGFIIDLVTGCTPSVVIYIEEGLGRNQYGEQNIIDCAKLPHELIDDRRIGDSR